MMEGPPSTPLSIQARIAALKGQAPRSPPPSYGSAVAGRKKPPPPLPKRPGGARSETTNNPPLVSHGLSSTRTNGNQPTEKMDILPAPSFAKWEGREEKQMPSIPPRRASQATYEKAPSPRLPVRKPSEQSLTRRQSVESVSSIASGSTALSGVSTRTSFSVASGNQYPKNRIRAPDYDAASLPPLPERKGNKVEEVERTRLPLRPTISAQNGLPMMDRKTSRDPPPSLPSRPALPSRQVSIAELVPPPRRSALEFGMNKATEIPPKIPMRPAYGTSSPTTGSPVNHTSPPPIPIASRPNLQELQRMKPKSVASGVTTPGVCLTCRDFSGPDNHAARFPREAIPSSDISWLAHQLCDPFPSATDKARAIFTWLHHNIAYDTVAFFGGNVRASTPSSTLATGLAVCSGYAGLFHSLAAPAGLESVVINGHGKGYSISAIKSSDPIPPVTMNHAWNAVKIDDGEWKLIDACWGAGVVTGAGLPYQKQFSPERFTQANDEFGIDHFPEDKRYFFRDDGRSSITWEEYMLSDAVDGEKLTVYGNVKIEHGFEGNSFLPKMMDIKIHDPHAGPSVRFQFNKLCPHYDIVAKHGLPYLFFIKFQRPGGEEVFRVFQTDGFYWWLDVNREDLALAASDAGAGADAGGGGKRDLFVAYVEHFGLDKTDGRGLSEVEFFKGMRMGRPGGWMGCQWNYLAKWSVV